MAKLSSVYNQPSVKRKKAEATSLGLSSVAEVN
jgi:hypothetical protein